jgi:hypothetical protein
MRGRKLLPAGKAKPLPKKPRKFSSQLEIKAAQITTYGGFFPDQAEDLARIEISEERQAKLRLRHASVPQVRVCAYCASCSTQMAPSTLKDAKDFIIAHKHHITRVFFESIKPSKNCS